MTATETSIDRQTAAARASLESSAVGYFSEIPAGVMRSWSVGPAADDPPCRRHPFARKGNETRKRGFRIFLSSGSGRQAQDHPSLSLSATSTALRCGAGAATATANPLAAASRLVDCT
jgi:hypothetical protein